MKKSIVFIVGGLIVLGIVASVGWYLVSPLFIDDVVDEAFPIYFLDLNHSARGADFSLHSNSEQSLV